MSPGERGGSLRSTAGLLANELATLARRWRTWAMLGALALIPVLIGVALRVFGARDPGRGPAFLDQVTQNGLFVGLAATVVAIPLFLPLTVSVTAGDAIAGEAGTGTLRYLLVAPAGRLRLLAVKFVSAAVFALAAAAVVMTAGTIVGAALFPVGPLTVLSGADVSVAESIGRLAVVTAHVAISLIGLTAIGVFFSTLTVVPVGAMATTAIVAVSAQIVGAIPQLEAVHPFLFTDRWLGFADLLRSPIVWESFAANAAVQAVYTVAFFGAACWRIARRDVLS